MEFNGVANLKVCFFILGLYCHTDLLPMDILLGPFFKESNAHMIYWQRPSVLSAVVRLCVCVYTCVYTCVQACALFLNKWVHIKKCVFRVEFLFMEACLGLWWEVMNGEMIPVTDLCSARASKEYLRFIWSEPEIRVSGFSMCCIGIRALVDLGYCLPWGWPWGCNKHD